MSSDIVSVLDNYYKCEREKNNKGYSQQLRLKYDDDVKYYLKQGLPKKDALHADNITSFWTVYKRLLELEAGWLAYKTEKSLHMLLSEIRSKSENDFTKKIIAVNEKLEPFANAVHSSGNYMLLPDRQMNNMRYKIAEDRIDLTLFHSFSGGKLARFFNNDSTLCDWIKREKLHFMFSNEIIDKNNLRWFVDNQKMISEMKKEEVFNYIEKAIDLIEYRENIP